MVLNMRLLRKVFFATNARIQYYSYALYQRFYKYQHDTNYRKVTFRRGPKPYYLIIVTVPLNRLPSLNSILKR